MNKTILPPKEDPVYSLDLRKARSQEEFIRGSMNKNPYLSTEVVSVVELRFSRRECMDGWMDGKGTGLEEEEW